MPGPNSFLAFVRDAFATENRSQLRQYEKISHKDLHLHPALKKNMLMVTINVHQELQNLKYDEQNALARGEPAYDYDQYSSLLIA